MRPYLALVWFRLKTETAYFGSKWTNALSTIAYSSALLLSVNLTIGQNGGIFGITTGQIYFLLLIGQASFYSISAAVSIPTSEWLIDKYIKAGGLDFMLLRPKNPTFYAVAANYNIIGIIRDGLPPLALVSFFIPWSELGLTYENILLGLVVFILGGISYCCLVLSLAWTAAWHNAESTPMISFAFGMGGGYKVPFSSLPGPFKLLVFTLLPSYIMDLLAASIMLGKTPAFPWILFSLFTAASMLAVLYLTERKALRAYASASS